MNLQKFTPFLPYTLVLIALSMGAFFYLTKPTQYQMWQKEEHELLELLTRQRDQRNADYEAWKTKDTAHSGAINETKTKINALIQLLDTCRQVGKCETAHGTPVSAVPLSIIPQSYASSNLISTTLSSGTTLVNKSTLNNQKNIGIKGSTIRYLQDNTEGGKKALTTEGKIQEILKLGYREEPTRAIFSACKEKANDPVHCLKVALSLMYNEAGNMQRSYACTKRYNCFGIQSGKRVLVSYQDGANVWVDIYNQYWYTAESARFFYAPAGSIPPSRYCTSEDSTGTKVGCPMGLSIAAKKWSQVSVILNQ